MKKLIIALVILCFSFPLAQATETVLYGGGEVITKSGENAKIGGGSVVGFGLVASDKVIIWLPNILAGNTGEPDNIWQVATGLTVFSGTLVTKRIPFGLFMTVTGGGGAIEGQKTSLASLSNIGFYFPLNERCKLYLGGAVSTIGAYTVFSVNGGMTMGLDFSK